MNMFAGLTGDKVNPKCPQCGGKGAHGKPILCDECFGKTCEGLPAMTSSSQCVDCGEPMMNCFCFTAKPKKKR